MTLKTKTFSPVFGSVSIARCGEIFILGLTRKSKNMKRNDAVRLANIPVKTADQSKSTKKSGITTKNSLLEVEVIKNS